jgi:hypothetical protein
MICKGCKKDLAELVRWRRLHLCLAEDATNSEDALQRLEISNNLLREQVIALIRSYQWLVNIPEELIVRTMLRVYMLELADAQVALGTKDAQLMSSLPQREGKDVADKRRYCIDPI